MAERKSGTTNSRKKGSRHGGTGCLVWLGLVLVMVLVFFLNRESIERVISNSKFKDALKTNSLDNAPDTGVKNAKPVAEPVKPTLKPETPTQKPAEPEKSKPEIVQEKPKETPKPEEPSLKPEKKPIETPEPSKIRKSTLYFVRLDDDGSIVRMDVKRTIREADSPLKDALTTVLKGPNDEELKKGLITLIPSGTRLLSITVRGTTAMVNLSEEFMFNSLGIEGYSGQLKQIIWTVTEFSTVKDVQILIDGKQIDYLGGEGVYIGRPLSRNSF